MLDAIKHITDDNLFFQEDSTPVHCVCNTIQLSENVIFAFPFCQVVQKHKLHGRVKRLLIAYFISNISATKYQNPFMSVSVIASQRGTFF